MQQKKGDIDEWYTMYTIQKGACTAKMYYDLCLYQCEFSIVMHNRRVFRRRVSERSIERMTIKMNNFVQIKRADIFI